MRSSDLMYAMMAVGGFLCVFLAAFAALRDWHHSLTLVMTCFVFGCAWIALVADMERFHRGR